MSDIDFDKGTRVRMQLDQMINQLQGMDVGLALVWLYVWDVMKDSYKSMCEDNDYTKANPDKTLDDVWTALWESPSFSLEFGVEALDEDIRDWLMTNEFILDVEDDEDLTDDDDDEIIEETHLEEKK